MARYSKMTVGQMTTTRKIRGYCTPQIVIRLHMRLVDPTSVFFKTFPRGANSNPSNSRFSKAESLSKPSLPTATLNASEIRQTHQLRDKVLPHQVVIPCPPGWQVGTFRISKVSRPSWHQGLWNKDGDPAVWHLKETKIWPLLMKEFVT